MISLIVPVYNTELFIERCLLSICQQTLENFEIIIIDDCSPDNAIEVAEKVLSKFPLRKEQTKIISLKTNQGLPNARKLGLLNSKGKYIASLDSDDYLESNALELMLNKIQEKDSDILVCDYFFSTKKKEVYIKQECSNSNEDFLKRLFTAKLQGFWWNKLYKRELLEKISIFTDIHMQEDLLVAAQMGLISSNIAYLPKPVVHYVQYNSNSMTKNYTDKSIKDLLFIISFIDDVLCSKNLLFRYKEEFGFRKKYSKLLILCNLSAGERERFFDLYENEKDGYKYLSLYHKTILWAAKLRMSKLIDTILFFKNKIKVVIGWYKARL